MKQNTHAPKDDSNKTCFSKKEKYVHDNSDIAHCSHTNRCLHKNNKYIQQDDLLVRQSIFAKIFDLFRIKSIDRSNNSNAGGMYTCPMHPEIIQNKSGDCPKCGMALESMMLNFEDNSEEKRLTGKLIFSLLFGIVLLIFNMGRHYIFYSWSMLDFTIFGVPINANVIEFILATPVVIFGGSIFFVRGYNSLKNKSLNMFTLISLGVLAAYLYSVIATLLPNLFPLITIKNGIVDVYFEASAVIIILTLIGQILETKARAKTGNSIKALLDLTPKKVLKLDDTGNQIEIGVEHIKIGNIIKLRAGEKIPVDAEVLEGQSSVNESFITGEPIAVLKTPGSKVMAGSINGSSTLLIVAKKVGSETFLASIIEMVSRAQRSQAKIQKIADIVSSYFVPIVIMIATISFGAWYIFGNEARLSFALVSSISVLLIACPCALGLATPISIMVASGRGALCGVLFKNAEVLEKLNKVDTLVFDKTGTLSEGIPKVVNIISFKNYSSNLVLNYAAFVAGSSDHPLSRAILKKWNKNNLPKLSNFENIPGRGIKAIHNGNIIAIGNFSLLEELSLATKKLKNEIVEHQKEGQSIVYVVYKEVIGYLGVKDSLRPNIADTINELKKKALKIIILTGDNEKTAKAITRSLKIDELLSEQTPTSKYEKIKQLQLAGAKIAMVGDGINDSIALTQADVGIAMGNGSDIAIKSADITLIKPDLDGVLRAINLSNKTVTNIHQNLFFAFLYNIIGVLIASGVLYPFFGILLSPMIAALAMSFSSVTVIFNSLRLNYFKI